MIGPKSHHHPHPAKKPAPMRYWSATVAFFRPDTLECIIRASFSFASDAVNIPSSKVKRAPPRLVITLLLLHFGQLSSATNRRATKYLAVRSRNQKIGAPPELRSGEPTPIYQANLLRGRKETDYVRLRVNEFSHYPRPYGRGGAGGGGGGDLPRTDSELLCAVVKVKPISSGARPACTQASGATETTLYLDIA